jgi:hypothetical protein
VYNFQFSRQSSWFGEQNRTLFFFLIVEVELFDDWLDDCEDFSNEFLMLVDAAGDEEGGAGIGEVEMVVFVVEVAA